jgi:hypothetical protein
MVVIFLQFTDHEFIPGEWGELGVCGAVRETAGYGGGGGGDWTAIGRSDRLFYYYIHTENIGHLD